MSDSSATAARIIALIAADIGARPQQVEAASALLDGGATVPFIARYRKEATGGLDDIQLRTLEERLHALRELEARRATIVETLTAQGNLTAELAGRIDAATTRSELEDLYLPYRPKRRTRAEIARERGLGPLADTLLADRSLVPETVAESFLNDEVPDVRAALEGARDILCERFAENADLVGTLRSYLRERAVLRAEVISGKEAEAAKYADYFDHREPWARVPGHRAQAMLRGRSEGLLALDLEIDQDLPETQRPVEKMIARGFAITSDNGATETWLRDVVRWTWRVRLSVNLSADLMVELRQRAEETAIDVFARNLKDLLLAAPAGPRATLGLDPGIRTGVKAAVVDRTGKLLETATLYPFAPRNDVRGAENGIRALIARHGVELIAIGNGTASRETEQLVANLLRQEPDPRPTPVVVSEAGASVYSASAVASAEFPDVDVALRGAISIARRLQDPLAELVKIEPRSIGVGQYQHDVDQSRLSRSLDAVVEDAVNAVGVDLNTASAPLLARVAGVGPTLADAIVAHRDQHGAFQSRQALLNVHRLGPRTFEQCAGFLRIRDGEDPLDATAVHPEAYPVARRIVAACGRSVQSLMGDAEALARVPATDFTDERFGLPTVRDILSELEKPGRDPRPEFRTARFAADVHTLEDLRPGMTLEGAVTNVAAFGAFVDIGVHQDGLVHISELADRYVKDPRDVVRAGQIVQVRVLDIDVARRRIALSMRANRASEASPSSFQNSRPAPPPPRGKPSADRPRGQRNPEPPRGALGAALADALKKR
ncbi:MAG: Tex family protein [Pseudomonadales bacterium]